MIRVRHLSKEFPRTGLALADISLQVAKGEFVFLTGPSGAGKSTLLKMLYLDERPTHGEIRIAGVISGAHGVPRREVALLRRKLGVIFQDFRLLDDRTVHANVAFALDVIGAPSATVSGRVSRVLAQVGLTAKASALPQELSGGEQQRVAIARALVNSPLVLLADEPTGNLDERASRGIFQLLREINTAGTSVIMATHNLDLIRRSDARTLEMLHGRLVADSGDPTVAERERERQDRGSAVA
jgi:cell division transport system ATP-binding protein